MPRKSPLSADEQAICYRLREYRKRLRLPRTSFALELSLDTEALSRLENARVPVKCSIVWRVAAQFPINIQWWATGEGSLSLPMTLPAMVDIGVDENRLFSEVYRKTLKPWAEEKVAKNLALQASVQPNQYPQTIAGRVSAVSDLSDLLLGLFAVVPDAKFNGLVNTIHYHIWKISENFEPISPDESSRIASEIANYRYEAQRLQRAAEDAWEKHFSKKPLTNIPTYGNSADVQTEMDKLLNRLRKATRERGKMAALAKYLNVKLAAVSEWLSDKSDREPGGEYTLRILNWVENEERQQKGPGIAPTLPEPNMAQPKRKTSHHAKQQVKPQSGQK